MPVPVVPVPTQRENLLREAAIHKRLHHPNIVQFIDFFETSENYYLIMELCVVRTAGLVAGCA